MSEIRTPWRFRTLRNTSPSKTTTGNTFLGFRKLVNNSLSAFPEDSLLVWRLKSTRSPSGRQSQRHSGEWVVARLVGGKTTRQLHQTQNYDTLFVVFYRQALSPLLFCVVRLLWGCSKRLLVQISLILQILAKKTQISQMSPHRYEVRWMHS